MGPLGSPHGDLDGVGNAPLNTHLFASLYADAFATLRFAGFE